MIGITLISYELIGLTPKLEDGRCNGCSFENYETNNNSKEKYNSMKLMIKRKYIVLLR